MQCQRYMWKFTCEKVNNSFFLSCQIHWCVAMSLFIIIPWGDDEQHYNEKGSDPYTKSSGLVMISWWMIVLPSVERDREKEWVVPFSCFARMALDKLQEASVLMSLFTNLLLLPEPLRYKSIISASLHFRSIDEMKINVNNQKVNQYAAELCQNELLTYK